MPEGIKVLLADGRAAVRASARTMLAASGLIEVVGEVEDGDQAITESLDLLPDILLLDLTMPRLPGLEAMRAIMGGQPRIKILLLNKHIRAQHIVEALQIGARGIVPLDAMATCLDAAIRGVFSGEYWLGDKPVDGLVAALHSLIHQRPAAPQPKPTKKTFKFTRREAEMIRHIVDGRSNREIAAQIGLSEETVKSHLKNVFGKVGVSTRLELAMFAMSHELVA